MVFQANPGEFSPVSESAYCASGVIHEMSLHAVRRLEDGLPRLQLFGGLPASWADAAFAGLRAAGGFSVAANRIEGRTEFVRIAPEGGDRKLLLQVFGDDDGWSHGCPSPPRAVPARP